MQAESGPRLQFAIREAANAYFAGAPGSKLASALPNDYGLLRIGRAQHLLVSLLNEYFPVTQPVQRRRFTAYLWQRVRLVATEVPIGFDLNRLFEAINNRGEQLQHHEILKSRFLACITNRKSRAVYAKLWNACAAMDGYLEQTTRQEVERNPADWRDGEATRFNLQAMIRELVAGAPASQAPASTRRLSQVLGDHRQAEAFAPDPDQQPLSALESASEPVRSILTFPQLLLHTLRLFQLNQGAADIARINEKELLQLFEASQVLESGRTAKQFIEL